jgi:hypothetical protein
MMSSWLQEHVGLDCLSNPVAMNRTTGLPEGHTMAEIKSGDVACDGGVTALGYVLFFILVVLHFLLFALPLILAWRVGKSNPGVRHF